METTDLEFSSQRGFLSCTFEIYETFIKQCSNGCPSLEQNMELEKTDGTAGGSSAKMNPSEQSPLKDNSNTEQKECNNAKIDPAEQNPAEDVTNVNQSSEDDANTEQEECELDDDPVVTLEDFFEEVEHQEQLNRALLGSQDSSVCSYPEGYKPRQTLFACLTCTPEPVRAGMCYGCSVHCHENHDIIELYTKRNFKCDCGNSKFGENKCKLYEEKSRTNEYNVYDHNYNGRFCVCDKTYMPERGGEDMVQCEMCEDWYHPSHIHMKDRVRSPDQGIVSMICPHCVKRLPFLRNFKSENPDVVCISKIAPVSDENVEQHSLLITNLRSKICPCSECRRIYDQYQCAFLLDEEDDLTNFEREGVRRSEENQSTSEDDVNDLIKLAGRDGAIDVLGGVNHMKRKLTEWLTEARDKGEVVKPEDVKHFFDQVREEWNEAKRARLE